MTSFSNDPQNFDSLGSQALYVDDLINEKFFKKKSQIDFFRIV